MKFILSPIYIGITLLSFQAGAQSSKSEAEKHSVEITTEDIKIEDASLENKLAKLLKKKGTLTSSRQGTDSYMVAVLCEYPKKEEQRLHAFKPYCFLKKVRVNSRAE
jgi:hypothetical protein